MLRRTVVSGTDMAARCSSVKRPKGGLGAVVTGTYGDTLFVEQCAYLRHGNAVEDEAHD